MAPPMRSGVAMSRVPSGSQTRSIAVLKPPLSDALRAAHGKRDVLLTRRDVQLLAHIAKAFAPADDGVLPWRQVQFALREDAQLAHRRQRDLRAVVRQDL